MIVEVNYMAIVVAAVLGMAVGSVWYAQGVFGNLWAKLAKVDMSAKSSPATFAFVLIAAFVFALVTAYTLANIAFLANYFYRNSFLVDALVTGLWVWLGFMAVRMATHDLFESRSAKLTLINAGHELATIMVMALVIGVMKP